MPEVAISPFAQAFMREERLRDPTGSFAALREKLLL